MPFQAIARAPVAAGAAIGRTVADRLGALEGDLEGDHAAQRAAGHEGQALDPERVEERPLGARLVARGDRREGRAVGPPGRRVRARRARWSRSSRRAGWRRGRRPGSCRGRGPAR